MPEIRLALIMSGGVSLGTYTAGALTEIHHALGRLNRNRADGTPAVRVEVLAGASSGAIGGALFARALTLEPDAIHALREAWVERISMAELLKRDDGGFHPHAIFSDRAVLELAEEYLGPPTGRPRWSSFATSPLQVGFTLTNLGGVSFPIEYANRERDFFWTRSHRDRVVVSIENPDSPRAGGPPARHRSRTRTEHIGAAGARDQQLTRLWALLRESAIASGAFPAAFPPRMITRDWSEYPYLDRDGPVDMWYVDGGVLDNEPIGLAKSLVDRNPEHRRLDYRYVLIDPYLDAPPSAPYDGPESLFGVLGALARVLMEESTARDWLRANRTNWRLGAHAELVNQQLRPLIGALEDRAPEAIPPVLERLEDRARDVARFKVGVNRATPPEDAPIDRYLRDNLGRIVEDPRYGPALDGLGERGAEVMIRLIFLAETAGGLRDKEPMDLYLIAPRSEDDDAHPLAGDFLRNFGGFFRREWREHDFLRGRRDARGVLQRDLGLLYDPEPGTDLEKLQPLRVGPQDLTARERDSFRGYLSARLKPLITPYLPWYAKPLRGRIADKAARLFMERLGF